MQLASLPRIKLANLPTPLEEAPRLSDYLRGPRIWIKRDDLTGLAMGGNKARKLEFQMGQARARDCDVVITVGAPQSNHARMTAAAPSTANNTPREKNRASACGSACRLAATLRK